MDTGDLSTESAALVAIGAALQPGGDLQIYGCDVGQGAAGDAFLQQLSQATGGANIAASSNSVGSAAEGGSWALNVDVGTADVASPFTATASAAYPDLLSLTANQIVFTASNGQSGSADTGNRVEQFGVSGSTVIGGSTIDLADGSQSIDSGVNYSSSGVAVDTALNEYFVAVDNPTTHTETIQKGSLTGAGGLSTFYTVPFPNFAAYNGTTIPVVAALSGLALDAQNQELYFAQDAEDINGNPVAADTGIYKVSLSGGAPTLVTSTTAGLTNPSYLALDTTANLLFFDDVLVGGGFPPVNNLDEVNLTTGAVTVLKSFSSSDPNFLLAGMAINTSNNTLYLATANYGANTSASNAILSIPFSVTGSGSSAQASLGSVTTLYSGAGADQPTDIVIDPAHGIFYTTGEDSGNYAGVFEGNLSGGTSLTEVLSMTTVVGSTAASGTNAPQLVLLLQPDVTAGGAATAISGGAAVRADSGVTVSDSDGQLLVNATVAIAAGASSGDTLAFNNGNAFTFTDGRQITGSFSGSTLTLSGNATVADYQQALDAVTFGTTSASTATRTLDWSVSDGAVASAIANSTAQVVVPPPVVMTTGGAVTFTGGGAAKALDSDLTVIDPSSTTLASATVSIGGFVSGDTLNFTNQSGITGSYDSATGGLTLNGTATIAAYQAALEFDHLQLQPDRRRSDRRRYAHHPHHRLGGERWDVDFDDGDQHA